MTLHYSRLAMVTAFAVASIGQVTAQQVIQLLHGIHVTGKIVHGGTASKGTGKEYLLVGVELAKPLEGGVDRIEAIVTHNEPSEKIRMSIGIYSGGAENAGTIDLSCPLVKIVSANGKKKAWADDCTFNRYDGPVVGD